MMTLPPSKTDWHGQGRLNLGPQPAVLWEIGILILPWLLQPFGQESLMPQLLVHHRHARLLIVPSCTNVARSQTMQQVQANALNTMIQAKAACATSKTYRFFSLYLSSGDPSKILDFLIHWPTFTNNLFSPWFRCVSTFTPVQQCTRALQAHALLLLWSKAYFRQASLWHNETAAPCIFA